MKKILSIFWVLIISLWAQQGFACHNSTINSVSFVDNGNGTKTYTINVSIDVGTTDGYSYGFALLFSNSCGTTPAITSLATAFLSRSGYSNLIGRYGSTIGNTFPGGAPNDYFLMRYANRTDVLTYEAIDNSFGFGSTDYNNRIIVVTVSDTVQTVTLDADFRSLGDSTTNAQCLKTSPVAQTCAAIPLPCGTCAAPTCPIAGPYTNYTNATGAAHTSNCQTITPNIVGPDTYLSYYTVVASASGKIGAIVSNDNTPNTCSTTRTAVLYLTSANCSGSTNALTPVLGANGSTFYNPEWSGLTPGATYIMVVTLSLIHI